MKLNTKTMHDMYVEIGLPMTDCEVVSRTAKIRLSDRLVRCNNVTISQVLFPEFRKKLKFYFCCQSHTCGHSS